MGRIKSIGLVLIVVVMSIGIIAMGVTPTLADEPKTLKIAVITSLSGTGAVWGRGVLHAAEMAVDEVERRGGLNIGGQKYKVELIPYDDKYTAAGGVASAHKAIFNDKVKFSIGPLSSAATLAIQETTEKNKILMLTACWSRDAISAKKPFTFRMYITAAEAAPGVIEWVKKNHPNAKTVVTIAPNDASGWAVGGEYVKAYEKAGFKVLSKEFPERKTKDFYPILTKIKSLKPDIIQECAIGVGAAALISKQKKELGIKAPLIGGAWIDPNTFVKSAGGPEMAEGYVYPLVFDRNTKDPEVVKFIERFRKKYGEKTPMTTVDPTYFDGVMMLFSAFEKAGSVDSEKVKEAFENMDGYQGIMGKLKWSGMETYGINHQIIQDFYIAQIRDGKEVIIESVE